MVCFLKLCPIFVGSLYNFGRSNDNMILRKKIWFPLDVCDFVPNLHKISWKLSTNLVIWIIKYRGKTFWHSIEDKANFSCSFINFFFEQKNTYLSQKAAQKALLFGCSGWSGGSSRCFGFYSFYRIFHSTSWCFWGDTCTCTYKDKSILSAVLMIKVLTVER